MATDYRQVVDFIGKFKLIQGRLAGEAFPVRPWQRRFLRGMYGAGGDAALSVARGCGKSTLIAGLALAQLYGPAMQPYAETVIVASSFSQGKIIFRTAQAFMQEEIDRKPARWRVVDNAQQAFIEDRETGARLDCRGNDHRRLHGLQPALVICDELAQWAPGSIERSLASLRTSMGKIPDSRMIAIGTRADAPEHEFEQMLTGGAEYSQVHSTPAGDPPFQKRSWIKANPGLQYLPDLEAAIRREAKRARKDSKALASFRALRLNQGVSDVVENVLLDADVWLAIEGEAPERSGPYVLGIDLGQNAAMSAAAAYWTRTGALDAFAVFPEFPDLIERGRQDGVDRLYQECHNRGELLQRGARVSDVGALLAEVRARWGAPGAIVCDRWREAELRQALAAARFPRCDLIVRGQGYKDGGADVREFRRACIDARVMPARSLLLRSAMSGARVSTDPAGNSKLAKGGEGRRSRARDDAAAAAILAVAEGRRRAKAAENKPAFSYVVI